MAWAESHAIFICALGYPFQPEGRIFFDEERGHKWPLFHVTNKPGCPILPAFCAGGWGF